MAYDYKKLFEKFNESRIGTLDPAEAFELKGFQLQHPEFLDSSHPLAFGDAQNTAQRSKDMSNDLEDAYKATTDIEELSKLFKGFAGELEENKMYNPSATGINAPSMFKQTKGQYGPQRKVFAGGYYETDPQGFLKNETYNMAKTGFMSSLGGYGGGFSSGPQTSAANISSYGQTPTTNLRSLPEQGLPSSQYDTSYSGTGTTELPDWYKKQHGIQ